MKNYKDTQNKLHVLDSTEFEYLLPIGCIAITEEEANIIANPPKPIEQIKADIRIKIKSERDRRSQTLGYKVSTKWFHSDASSRIQQLALTMAGTSLPSGLMWKTLDGSFIEMTPTLAKQIFQAALGSDSAIFTVAETHRTNLEASTTPETYDYLSGWPIGFGE